MRKQAILLYITVFINILGFGMIFPILPLFAEEFHATYLEIGLIAATFSMGQFLAAPFWGRLSDRFGRKPILISSMSGSIVSYLFLANATNLEFIFFSRFLTGLASAGAFPIVQAYIADITTKEERTEYMGKISAMFAIGFIFGPVFGGFLGDKGFSLAFYASAIVVLLNIMFVFFFLPESLKIKAEKLIIREGFINLKAIYHGLRGDFGVLFFLLFTWAFYISNFQVAIPLFTEHVFSMGPLENGLFFSVVGIVAGIVQWFVLPIVVKAIGEFKTILVGTFFMIIGQILAPLSSTAFLFYGFFVISTAGSGLHRPTINAVLSKATHEGQGTTMGLAFSFESLGRLVGPLLAGFAIGRFGLQTPFWITAVVLFISLFAFISIERRRLK